MFLHNAFYTRRERGRDTRCPATAIYRNHQPAAAKPGTIDAGTEIGNFAAGPIDGHHSPQDYTVQTFALMRLVQPNEEARESGFHSPTT